MLNRCAVTIRLKQPFLDWLNSLPDPLDLPLEMLNRDPPVYLLPFIDLLDQQDNLLEDFHDLIFEGRLAGYWTNEGDWPEERTFEMFKAWFEFSFSSVIVDLVDGEPLELEQ
jgi:hypothetical protein